MSSENLRIVQTLLDAWNSGSLDSVQELVSDDMEWLEIGGMLGAAGAELRGWDRLREGRDSIFDVFQSYQLELETTFEEGDRVVAIVKETARGRSSGAEVGTRFGYVITVRDGKVARVEAYRDPDQAISAAGGPSPG
jgi:ketosteroid isomerase-like protein